MDIQEMGVKVSETLAIKGKVDSLTEQVGQVKAQIGANEREINHLQSLIKTNEVAEGNLKDLEKELGILQAELESRLDSLKAEGIVLPLGEKVVRSRRM